jgi:plastocyanin
MKKRWIFVAVLVLAFVASTSSLLAVASGVGLAGEPISPVTPEPAVAAATVSISNFQFAPKVVRIKAGSEVTWQVKEGTHTVTADGGGFESPALSAGQKFSHQFATPGTYRYYCSFHGSKGGHDMAGTVIVTK